MLAAARQVRIGLRDALDIMREAASGQHHAMARADAAFTALAPSKHANRLAVLDQDLLGRRAGQDRDAEVQRRLGQPRSQRVAAGHVDGTPIQRQLLEVVRQPLGDIDERGQRLGDIEEMLEIGIRRVEHHADEGDGLERQLQARHVLAQAADVVGRGQDRTTDLGAARQVRVVVGIERRDELHLGLALEELDHPRAVLDEGVDHGFVVERSGLLHHVAAHGVGRIGRILLAAMLVHRNPEHPARQRGGAAEDRLLLQHDDVETALLGGDGGGQAGSAGADDDQVTFGSV